MKKTALNLLCLYVLLLLSPLRVLADSHAPHCSESVADSLHSPVSMSDYHELGLDKMHEHKDLKNAQASCSQCAQCCGGLTLSAPAIETPFIPAAPFTSPALTTFYSSADALRFDRPPRA
ncbi:MAG: hypothetical protein IPM37_14365 [Hahellaceae bacterium]|nr:hypothetical protein [Hahellaceae bacterium]